MTAAYLGSIRSIVAVVAGRTGLGITVDRALLCACFGGMRWGSC